MNEHKLTITLEPKLYDGAVTVSHTVTLYNLLSDCPVEHIVTIADDFRNKVIVMLVNEQAKLRTERRQ